MGAKQSTLIGPDYNALSLPPQPEGICLTQSGFCLDYPIQLRLREILLSTSRDDFKVIDADSGVVHFFCSRKPCKILADRMLRDQWGQPVLYLKEQFCWSQKHKFKIYSGMDSSQQICKVDTFPRHPFRSTERLMVHFKDVVTGRPRYIVLKGNWNRKECTIYNGEPEVGGVPIAKVSRPLTRRSFSCGLDSDYVVEIAPRVDIALVVIMCIALDEHVF